MAKISTTVVSAEDVWNGKLFKVEAENGKVYKVWKSEFPNLDEGAKLEGEEHEKPGKFGNELFLNGKKEFKGGGKGGFAPDPLRNKVMVLSYAKDLAVAKIASGVDVGTDEIVEWAKELMKFVV